MTHRRCKKLESNALLGAFFAAAAWLMLLAPSGCASSASPSSDSARPAQFGAQAVARFCARTSACCSQLNYPFDEAGCEALVGNGIVQYFYAEDFVGAQYDPAAAQRCLDGIYTPQLGCSASGDYQSADCQQVFVGHVPLGGTCSESEGCAAADGAATMCKFPPNPDLSDPSVRGVCVLNPSMTSPHGNAGDACSSSCTETSLCITSCSTDSACQNDLPACYAADGLYCSDTGTCIPLGGAGDPCRGSAECGTGTYCAADSTCEPLLHAGDACVHQFQCDTGYCSSTCAPQPVASPQFCLGQIPPPPVP